MFSGGIGSWATAKRVAEQHGTENLLLLFADTLVEDDDLYRFLLEATANIYGLDLATVWQQVIERTAEAIAEWRLKEAQFRAEKDKDVSILRDCRGGEFKPLPLSALRSRWESLTQKQRNKIRRAWAKPEQLSLLTADGLDLLDWGGCGCFAA